jgi:D-sedoheptulose 7-phosphate isomerase
MEPMSHTKTYFGQVAQIAATPSYAVVGRVADELVAFHQCGGQVFFLRVSGNATNFRLVVNDFHKLCGIATYSPVPNVAEPTAGTNDEGWGTVSQAGFEPTRANDKDVFMAFSVDGGGSQRQYRPCYG